MLQGDRTIYCFTAAYWRYTESFATRKRVGDFYRIKTNTTWFRCPVCMHYNNHPTTTVVGCFANSWGTYLSILCTGCGLPQITPSCCHVTCRDAHCSTQHNDTQHQTRSLHFRTYSNSRFQHRGRLRRPLLLLSAHYPWDIDRLIVSWGQDTRTVGSEGQPQSPLIPIIWQDTLLLTHMYRVLAASYLSLYEVPLPTLH